MLTIAIGARTVRTFAAASLFAFVSSAACPVLAQGANSVTIITGVISGPNGKVLRDALVEARSLRTQITRKTTSSDVGKFVIVSNDSSGAFRVTVKATGYLPWSGDVRKGYTGNQLPLNVTLQPGGTAADWPPPPEGPPPLRYARTQLGSSDAIEVTVAAGDIIIHGSSSDEITYRTSAKIPIPSNGIDPEGLYRGPIAPRGTQTIGPEGLSIVEDTGMVLFLEVPRNLHHIKLNVTTQGFVSVSNIDGELTVVSASGGVSMGRISGPTFVEARDGDIGVALATIPSAMSFLGRNGNITLRIPVDARVSFSNEVHRGTITLDSTSHIEYGPDGSVSVSEIENFRRGAPPPDAASKLPWILNGGGATITVRALNGNIFIRRPGP